MKIMHCRHKVIALTALMMALLLCSGAKQQTFKENLSDKDARMVSYLETIANIRTLGMDKPDKVIGYYFSDEAKVKWRTSLLGKDMNAQQLADFYTGALPLPGPQSQAESISALYNPWWDAMMLFRIKPVEATSDAIAHMAITEFHFLSGETFRGEKAAGKDVKYLTVVPDKDPISVEVWRVLSATRARFEKLMPLSGRVTYGGIAMQLLSYNEAKELERIQVRAALRLKFALMLLQNKTNLGKSAILLNLVKTSGKYQLFRHFRAKESFKMTETFGEMPDIFRKDFIPYGYLPTAEGVQYLFINKKVSRLYVTISVPKDVPKKPAQFEWYDLAQADKFLEAWNAEQSKGGAK